MKKLIVSAIQEDESIKADTLVFVSRVVALATGKCGVTTEQLGKPEFQAAVTLYGNKVGAKVMQDAFARMK